MRLSLQLVMVTK